MTISHALASTLLGLCLAAPGPGLASPRARIGLVEALQPFRNPRPYFAGGTLARAARYASRGRCRPALRALSRALHRRQVPETLRGQAAFLAGRCAHRLRRYKAAAPLLVEAVESYPELRDEARYLLGDALLRLGELSRAASVLAEVPPQSPRFEIARLAWAQAINRSEPAARAAELLMRFLADHPLDGAGMPPLPPVARPPSRQTGRVAPARPTRAPGKRALTLRAEIAYLTARALERAGKLAHAVSQLQYVWARFPRTKLARSAQRQLRRLRRKVGRDAAPSLYHRFLRGRSLLAAGKAHWARRVLARALRISRRTNSADVRWDIKLALGIASVRSGAWKAGLRHLRRMAAQAPDPSLRATAAYRAASVLARKRRVRDALKAYREAVEQHAGHAMAPAALLDGAELARLYRRDAEAKELYQLLVTRYPGSGQRATAEWRLGWMAYRSGTFDDARRHFLAAVRQAGHSRLQRRALYWLGRSREQRKLRAPAAAAFELLRRNYPLSFYAYLARERLGGLVSPDPRPDETALAAVVRAPHRHPAVDFADPLLGRARELVRLGLHAQARNLLRRYERSPNATAAGRVAAAALFASIGSRGNAHWTLRLRTRAYRIDPAHPDLVEFWHLAYPRRYVKALERAARRAKIPAPLLMAIVREESSFRPRAVSPQRAMGLTQVIWATATDMARQLRIRLRSRKDLFRPALNAMIGARFLSKLIRYYRGRRLLATAAYNAGPGNVDRWLRERGLRRTGPVPEDEVVEDIPFAETRAYVRKVFSSYAAYAYLYYGERVASLLPSHPPR